MMKIKCLIFQLERGFWKTFLGVDFLYCQNSYSVESIASFSVNTLPLYDYEANFCQSTSSTRVPMILFQIP